MGNPVKVSVIMGVYNPRLPRLEQAVASILRQSLPGWELLLYDDGSAEPAAAALRQAAARDGRIRYIRGGQNRGLAHALNVCIRQARGEYIARLDDDDTAREDRLQKQADFLDTHPAYQWVGSWALLEDAGGVWGMLRPPESPEAADFLPNSPYIHPSVTFRRDILLQYGGYSTAPENRLLEDYELFMRLHAGGGRGYNLPEPLLRYWEDRDACKKRGYRRRLRETALRRRGFRELGLLRRPAALPYLLKPLLVGLLPPPLYRGMRRALYGYRQPGAGGGHPAGRTPADKAAAVQPPQEGGTSR